MRFIVACCLVLSALLPLLAQGAIYQWKDERGNMVFSDRPHQGAKKIELAPTQVYSSTQVKTTTASASEQKAADKPPEKTGYSGVNIVSPKNDESIRSNDGKVVVSVTVQPSLRTNDKIVIFLDGQKIGKPQAGTSFDLTNVDRGTHQLKVAVVNGQGRELKQSLEITFHLQRISILPKS